MVAKRKENIVISHAGQGCFSEEFVENLYVGTCISKLNIVDFSD